MSMGSWSTTEKALKRLEADGKVREIEQLLDSCLDLDSSPGLAYWRGKLALEQQSAESALPWFADAVDQQPDRAHAWYLLGACLVRNKQVLDAQAALNRSLTLQPQFLPSRVELARVTKALGNSAAALELLEPVVDQLQTTAQISLWGELLSDTGADPEQLSLAFSAGHSPRLAESLLNQWLQLAAGLQLADQPDLASSWLLLLLTVGAKPARFSSAFPSRLVLLALLLLELDSSSGEEQHIEELMAQLRSLLWLPPAWGEANAWRRWMRDLLLQTAGQLEEQKATTTPRQARILKAVLDALPAVQATGENNFDLYLRLDQLRLGMVSDPERGARSRPRPEQRLANELFRHQRDLDRLSGVIDQLLQLQDRALLSQRSTLEAHLGVLSDLALHRPLLLVAHGAQKHLAVSLSQRQNAVELLARANRTLSTLTPALPPHTRPRQCWLLLATDDLPQCFTYRVLQKQQQLEALGCETRVVLREQLNDWAWSQHLLWADALVVCRLPALQPVLRAIESARRAGLPTYYDLDDLIVDPQFCPPELDTYGGTLTAEQHRGFVLDVPLFAAAMRACDAAIVSTFTLARRWRALHPGQPVHVLANLAPPELIQALQPPCDPARVETLRLVVASGTTAHKQIWIEELAPAIERLMTRHSQLRLELLGHLQMPRLLLKHRARIQCHPFAEYATYLQHMAKADIGLVALEPGTFTDAKSAIRWMEFSYLGLASVLSPSRTYTEILEEGVHARFARGEEQWVDQVEMLLADPGERLAMARRAQRHAQQLFGPHKAKDFWSPLLRSGGTGLFRSLGPAQKASKPRRRRLLLLNVFFAPQSVGGATRVAQDQVKALVDQLGDRWEVTVLCTDKEPWQAIAFSEANRLDAPANAQEPVEPKPIWEEQWPLPVDVHDWHGARVVRLAMPLRAWREHQDASVETFCRQWFPTEAFDLIHAHCLQVLSVGPLKVAAELQIPYLVTLHDGWWLSPSQFLTSSSGRAVDPADPISHYDAPEQVEPERLQRDRQRRQELEQVLAGAAARLAVSESFAQLHRQAGIEDVTVMDNRWQPMPSAQPRQRRPPDQTLRCCFVGGMSLHKGMAVLQSALLQARPAAPGLVLTVIDSTLNPGDQYQLSWGDTPVEFLPAVSMGDMAAFYAEQDVLLAPSIWPESYGLVSREALSAGLWVVASEIGALADPIRHGENGHRVPPRDAMALAGVLEQLAEHHPTPQPLFSFGVERSPLHKELDALYRGLL